MIYSGGSLVWIAKKPFAMMMIPPFAVCRIDDASGSHDNFGYAATLREFGWKSNIGLFTDDTLMRKKLKRLRNSMMTDPHSFLHILSMK